MDQSSYGVILAAIFSPLQFIYQSGDGSGGLNEQSRIHLQHRVSLCGSISLITLTTLTSCKPLAPKISHQISLLFVVLACAFGYSAALPENLWWLPLLSSIHLLFEILRDIYRFCIHTSFDQFQPRIREFRQNIESQCKLLAHEIRQRFVRVNLNSSSSTPVNLSSEGVNQVQQVFKHLIVCVSCYAAVTWIFFGVWNC